MFVGRIFSRTGKNEGNKKMKAIYYSNLVPLSLYREISEKTGVYSSQAIQKFHGLLCAGLEQVMELECVSSLPVAGRLGMVE